LLHFCGVLGGSSEGLFGFIELSLLAVDVSGQVEGWNGVWDSGQDFVDVLLSLLEVLKEEGVDPDEVELSHDSCLTHTQSIKSVKENTEENERKKRNGIRSP